jgi:hypothetical protein
MFVFNDTFELATPAERQLATSMVTYWTNFVQSGSPNVGGQRPWHFVEAISDADTHVPSGTRHRVSDRTVLPAWPEYVASQEAHGRDHSPLPPPSRMVLNITKGTPVSSSVLDIHVAVEDALTSERCALFGI